MFTTQVVASLFAFAIVVACVSDSSAETRRWSDKSGNFSVDAELVETKPDSVVLKKAGGATITVPIARLSDADREFLKSLTQPDSKPTANSVEGRIITFPDAVTERPAWNDSNTPFDMAAFLKGPPPEENAASLYLEAFYEFSPSDMVDILFPKMPQEERRQRFLARLPLRNEQMRLDDAWEKDRKSVKPAEVDAWLANYDLGFDKLAAAEQRPKCMFQPGRSFDSLIPHTWIVREVGWIVEWRTRRDLERGNLERPHQDLKMLLRLGRDLQVRGGGRSQLVAVNLNDRCCELARMILNAPGIKTSHCNQLLAEFVEHEASQIDAFVEGNRAEFITSRQALYDLQHRTGTFDPKTMKEKLQKFGDVTSPVTCLKYYYDWEGHWKQAEKITPRLQSALLPGAWQGGKMLSDENYAKEVAAVNGFFSKMLALAEDPDFRRKPEPEIKAAEALIDETIFASILIPYELGMLEAPRRAKARLRGKQCLIALKRWQLEHAGEAPLDLATAVKAAGLPSVPIDPYSDEPLRMATLDGKPVIYSVGPDGKDDLAQLEWKLAPGKPGDFIFRLDAESN